MSQVFAQDLIRALETLLRVSDEQSQALAKSRAAAAQTAGLFFRQLEDRLAGRSGATPTPPDFPQRQISDITSSRFPHLERESAFLDAFQALMRLHGRQALRTRVESIFELLREIRLIDAGEEAGELKLNLRPPAPPTDGTSLRDSVLQSMLTNHREISEKLQSRQAAWDEAINLQHAKLQQALMEARALLSAADPDQ